ncbi:MAG: erythromycin esterase family protein [Verrucomicrobia bacterium]|nr:erythromycin esterase family protein [Verrucomicrobiota bacterium]
MRPWSPAAALRGEAVALAPDSDFAPVISFIGGASLVLLGEASHGTEEFYASRAAITRRLIAEKGFNAVAIEGDWPDAYRVNRFVHGRLGHDAEAALAGFKRFPSWMWRNRTVREFAGWLRESNASRPAASRAGFYGLDLYSLRTSIEQVIAYLEHRDPAAARAARSCYACFDQFGPDTDAYALAFRTRADGDCQEAVARQLAALHEERSRLLARDGEAADEEFFHAEQNARLAVNAERYYRTMFEGRVSSWNLRDEHMAETLEGLLAHLRARGPEPKVVVWAHNSHLGDARATQMGEAGELNLGQLVRQKHAHAAKLIGFTTHHGTVMAASDWGGPARRKRVLPALKGSCEDLFHEVELARFFLPLDPGSVASRVLAERRLERAIGVIYRPETERQSHYFWATLPEQFDAVLHFDETKAVSPLESAQPAPDREPAETFPSGI